jgi:PKHD-type hydroxylase
MIIDVTPYNNLNFEHVVYWENFFTEDELNKILSLPDWYNVSDGIVGYENELNPNIRSSKISWLRADSSTSWIYSKISQVIAEANNQYFKYDISGLYENIQLAIYEDKDNGHYNWHIDSGNRINAVSRKLSFAMLLDDPSTFEGGDLEVKYFSNDAIKLEQKKGRAWIFPSHTLHRVTPVIKGVRRSLVVWAGGPSFK